MFFTAPGQLSSFRKRYAGPATLALIACLATLAVLSWLPAAQLQRTGLGANFEHFVAYAGTAFLVGFLRSNRHILADLALLIGYAALLEFGQGMTAGRIASVDDFMFSAAGAIAGRIAIPVLRWCYYRIIARRNAATSALRP